jgi:hypothetical protein
MYDGNRETVPERSAHGFPLLNPAGKPFHSGNPLEVQYRNGFFAGVAFPLSWTGLFKSQSGSTGTAAGNPPAGAPTGNDRVSRLNNYVSQTGLTHERRRQPQARCRLNRRRVISSASIKQRQLWRRPVDFFLRRRPSSCSHDILTCFSPATRIYARRFALHRLSGEQLTF